MNETDCAELIFVMHINYNLEEIEMLYRLLFEDSKIRKDLSLRKKSLFELYITTVNCESAVCFDSSVPYAPFPRLLHYGLLSRPGALSYLLLRLFVFGLPFSFKHSRTYKF